VCVFLFFLYIRPLDALPSMSVGALRSINRIADKLLLQSSLTDEMSVEPCMQPILVGRKFSLFPFDRLDYELSDFFPSEGAIKADPDNPPKNISEVEDLSQCWPSHAYQIYSKDELIAEYEKRIRVLEDRIGENTRNIHYRPTGEMSRKTAFRMYQPREIYVPSDESSIALVRENEILSQRKQNLFREMSDLKQEFHAPRFLTKEEKACLKRALVYMEFVCADRRNLILPLRFMGTHSELVLLMAIFSLVCGSLVIRLNFYQTFGVRVSHDELNKRLKECGLEDAGSPGDDFHPDFCSTFNKAASITVFLCGVVDVFNDILYARGICT
jgi:hypothetical protein